MTPAQSPELTPELVGTLQALMWSDSATRGVLQDHGVTLTPANFYSTVPSMSEIDASFEATSPFPYLHAPLFDRDALLGVLQELAPFAGELQGPREDDHDRPSGFFWDNGQFGYSDAIAYYCFLRSRKPKTVLEIGAGFSTLVASAALEANGHGEIVCIEPYPRPFLEGIARVREVVRSPIQAIGADWINETLHDGDVLFIDSTHTVKIGSDCLHLYLRVLPALRRRLLVHVHDIFLPDGMPQKWARDLHVYWTEQYLLMAYLLDNPKVRTLWGSHYHAAANHAALEAMMPPGVLPGGSSFWFERTP